MGKPNPILTIVVADEWWNSPPVEELANAGHKVYRWSAFVGPVFDTPDLILHPAAHWWSEDMWPYLPAALTAARKRRRERNAVHQAS